MQWLPINPDPPVTRTVLMMRSIDVPSVGLIGCEAHEKGSTHAPYCPSFLVVTAQAETRGPHLKRLSRAQKTTPRSLRLLPISKIKRKISLTTGANFYSIETTRFYSMPTSCRPRLEKRALTAVHAL